MIACTWFSNKSAWLVALTVSLCACVNTAALPVAASPSSVGNNQTDQGVTVSSSGQIEQLVQVQGELRQFGPDRLGFWGVRTAQGQVWRLAFNSVQEQQYYAGLMNQTVSVNGVQIADDLSRPQLLVRSIRLAP